MTALCYNRPEGFGPQSNLYPHHLTSCFCDVILVPLSTWIFLVMILFTLLNARRRHSRGKAASEVDVDHPITAPPHRNRVYSAFYSFLIIAAIAMTALEIARLVSDDLGVGLLPFTFVGIIFATTLHFSHGLHGRISEREWPILNATFWLLMVITLAVKISEEMKEGSGARKGSMYPESDEIIDVATMLGVFSVLAILDGALVVSGARRPATY